MNQTQVPASNGQDESPINLTALRNRLPRWIGRFIPSGGGQHGDRHGKKMFGVTIFLLSESMVFVSFFASYITLRLTTSNWLPDGVSGPEASFPVVLNTVILVSSSFVIFFAERALERDRITQFRVLWLLTTAMGTYFLFGELQEWQGLDFGLTSGIAGGTFYILTGFHGLHVTVGIILQLVMLARSFFLQQEEGHFGVSAVSLFWHFVDVIWLVLFSLIYLW